MCHSPYEVCFVLESSMVLHQFEAAGNIDRLRTAGVEDMTISLVSERGRCLNKLPFYSEQTTWGLCEEARNTTLKLLITIYIWEWVQGYGLLLTSSQSFSFISRIIILHNISRLLLSLVMVSEVSLKSVLSYDWVIIDRVCIVDRIYWTLWYNMWIHFTNHWHTQTSVLSLLLQRRTVPLIWVPLTIPGLSYPLLTAAEPQQSSDWLTDWLTESVTNHLSLLTPLSWLHLNNCTDYDISARPHRKHRPLSLYPVVGM
jgi:hypothetical protein